MKRPLIFACYLLIVLGTTSCYRYISIEGSVYEMREGLIAEFTGKELPEPGEPLEDAKVTWVLRLDDGGIPADAFDFHETWKYAPYSGGHFGGYLARTDREGRFTLYLKVTGPKEDHGFIVSKEGYETVATTYVQRMKGEPHKFLIFLKPEEGHEEADSPGEKK